MVILRQFIERAAGALPLRHVVGLCAIGLVVIGVWGLAGWAWACIAGGAPFAGFYLWGEARAVSPGAPD